ncbi:hypothetical protein GCM10020001_063570 [Nonomuraea salmonea]
MSAQWVVARRPSRRPAAASRKAPVQMETRRVPGRTRDRAARAGGSGTAAEAGVMPYGGMITVSASASTSGPWPGG